MADFLWRRKKCCGAASGGRSGHSEFLRGKALTPFRGSSSRKLSPTPPGRFRRT